MARIVEQKRAPCVARLVLLLALALVAAVAAASATARVERVGPAPASWAHELCAPEPHHPCGEGVLQGGWPVAYLLDSPGISVMGRLSIGEDLFRPAAFAIDVLAFWGMLAAPLYAYARRAAARVRDAR